MQSDFAQFFQGEKHAASRCEDYFGVRGRGRRGQIYADPGPLPGRATDFSYAQNVQSAYVSYAGAPGKKLITKPGSRVERTALAAGLTTTGTGFSREYGALLPTGSVQYAFSDISGLLLAYGCRITRPAIYYLNPFVEYANQHSITYGNLDPELTDIYEASCHPMRRGAQLGLTGGGAPYG